MLTIDNSQLEYTSWNFIIYFVSELDPVVDFRKKKIHVPLKLECKIIKNIN